MHPLATRLFPLAVLAGAGIAFSGWTAWTTVRPLAVPAVAVPPPQASYAARVSASGLVEGDGEDTVVGVPEAALVAEVGVRIGDLVKPGDLLLRLDDRLVRAELAVAESELAAVRSRVARLESLPRAEDAEPLAARVAVAEAHLADAKVKRGRIELLFQRNAISADEVDARRAAETIARAQVASAKADLAHVQLPAWGPDLAAARAEIPQVEARIAAIRTRLSRLEVRAPRAGTVIGAGAMVGELAAPGDRDLVVLAALDRLLVRLEIDESQAWKLRPGAGGRAWVRGDRAHVVELAFERVEPKAGPRRAIAGVPGERLDGRAVQVLYRLQSPPAYYRPGLMLESDLDADVPLAGAATVSAAVP